MALTNVAEMVEGRTQRRMLEEGVLKPLQKLAASPLVDVRREVARAVSTSTTVQNNTTTIDHSVASF